MKLSTHYIGPSFPAESSMRSPPRGVRLLPWTPFPWTPLTWPVDTLAAKVSKSFSCGVSATEPQGYITCDHNRNSVVYHRSERIAANHGRISWKLSGPLQARLMRDRAMHRLSITEAHFVVRGTCIAKAGTRHLMEVLRRTPHFM